jgi:hypothetical protein
MTHPDFNQLLSSLNRLSPGQLRQLRQQLDRKLAEPERAAPPASAKTAKRGKAVSQPAKKPLSIDEIHQEMMARGLIIRLPDPALDADDDDPDDQPIAIGGEPLSETILRERR